jgi:hypothetical protein
MQARWSLMGAVHGVGRRCLHYARHSGSATVAVLRERSSG